MDTNLARHLTKKDMEKGKRQYKQATKGYKARRSANKYSKFAVAHRDQLEELKTGAKFETGVAVQVAKKSLKNAPKRNPEGTLLADWKCPYFHKKFCNTKGHKDCRSENCYMNGKPKNLRDEAVKEIEYEAIALKMDANAIEGKST